MRLWQGAVLAGCLLAALLLPIAHSADAAAVPLFTGGGFDTCSAPSVSQMSAWLHSPYRSIGIYVGGVNRGCGDGNLSAAWVAAVEAQGWSLVPLYVGLQAPCVSQGGLATIAAGSPALQGVQAADDAVARAARFGLGAGNPIYFDMEGYGASVSCSQTVQTFLNSWTVELHKKGYVSGVYGSSASTIADLATAYLNPAYHAPDDVWFAHWNGCASDLDPGYFPNQYWSSHQRLHQYIGNTTETWGGVTLNIDRDYDNGAVAGPGRVAGSGSPSCSSGNGWAPWSQVTASGAGVVGTPAVASWSPGRLDLFVQGGDHVLYHRWSNDGGLSYSGWESLGAPPGGLVSSPAAVSWGPNRIDVFGRGADGALWHRWWSGRVGDWERLGGILASAPTVASWSGGRLDVFVIGAGHALYHTWWDGVWHPFEGLGGYGVLDPGATSWGPNRIDLLTLGSNDLLYHRWYNGVWSNWYQEVPGFWFSGPSVASPSLGRIDVMLESSDNGQPLGHAYWAQGWHQDVVGGSLTSAPAAVRSFRQMDVFVRGTDGNLWHTFLPF